MAMAGAEKAQRVGLACRPDLIDHVVAAARSNAAYQGSQEVACSAAEDGPQVYRLLQVGVL